MTVSCEDAQFAYLDEKVTPEIEQHMAACARCTFFRGVRGDLALDATGTPDPALDVTAASGGSGTGSSTSERLPQVARGRYQVDDEIGRGGLGRVLRAHDLVLDRTIAIKELQDSDDASRRRFVREALITARLQHPAIVPVYEAARWSDRAPFYAMKLVAGRPLSKAIADAPTLDVRLALVPTVLAVADAIAYAHSERIIHRDLKPGNVMVGAFGETVVIDWGLAKDLSIDDREAPDAGPYREAAADRTVAGTVLGTPAYMAPEQAARDVVDERADVYALGAMLYHVVAGCAPHEGDTRDEVIERVIRGNVTPVSAREPGVPADLAAIVDKAMALAKADRYPTARELAEDLRRFVSGQLVAVHRYSLRELVRRWARRHRVALIVSAVAAVVLLAYGTWSVRRIVRESERADTARDQAIAQANRAVLAQARMALATDPTEALRLLTTLSKAGPGWDSARVIAADALSRPRVIDTATLRQDARPPIETSKWTIDVAHGRAFFWSSGTLWIVELATGSVKTIHKSGYWPDDMVPCDDGKRLVSASPTTAGATSVIVLELAADAPEQRSLDDAAARAFLAGCRADPLPTHDSRSVVAPDGTWTAVATPERLEWRRGPHLERVDVLLDNLDRDTAIESLEVSADGRWLIARASNAPALAWNLAAGAWKQTLGTQPAVAAAWAGQDRVMTRDTHGIVRVWALTAPRMILPDPNEIVSSPDARWIIDETEDGLHRVDASGQYPDETSPWPVPRPLSPTVLVRPGGVSPGGDVLVVIGADVWTWRRVGGWERLGAAPETGALPEPIVAWTREGAPMVWADREIVVWERGHERRIAPLATPAVRRLVAVRDDLALAAAIDTTDGTVLLVDLARRTEAPLPGSSGASNEDRVGFSGDGRTLVTGAADPAADAHLVWDVATARARTIPRGDASRSSIAISRDGQHIALGTPNAVVLVDVVDSARHLLDVGASISELAFDDAGARLVTASGDGAMLWDVGAREGRLLVRDEPRFVHVGAAGVTVATARGVFRFADDLPAEPCALLARLGARCTP